MHGSTSPQKTENGCFRIPLLCELCDLLFRSSSLKQEVAEFAEEKSDQWIKGALDAWINLANQTDSETTHFSPSGPTDVS
jgi:hypothetical protein